MLEGAKNIGGCVDDDVPTVAIDQSGDTVSLTFTDGRIETMTFRDGQERGHVPSAFGRKADTAQTVEVLHLLNPVSEARFASEDSNLQAGEMAASIALARRQVGVRTSLKIGGTDPD